tara:strand:- start:185 stop:358 length:174 start_codon:yes stop_codon:yes gene_type:complete
MLKKKPAKKPEGEDLPEELKPTKAHKAHEEAAPAAAGEEAAAPVVHVMRPDPPREED